MIRNDHYCIRGCDAFAGYFRKLLLRDATRCTAGRVRFKNFLRSGVFRLIITLRIIEQILSVISRVLRPGRFLAERMAGRGNL